MARCGVRYRRNKKEPGKHNHSRQRIDQPYIFVIPAGCKLHWDCENPLQHACSDDCTHAEPKLIINEGSPLPSILGHDTPTHPSLSFKRSNGMIFECTAVKTAN